MLPGESSTFTKALTLQSARRHRIGPIRRKLLRIKEAGKNDQGDPARHQRGDAGCRPSAPSGSRVCAGAAVGAAGSQAHDTRAAAPASATESSTASAAATNTNPAAETPGR